MFESYLICFVLVISHLSAYPEYYVTLEDDSPVVIGANVTFHAKLFHDGSDKLTGNYQFEWQDNVYPQHLMEQNTQGSSESTWSVAYIPDSYKPGTFEVEVNVYDHPFIIRWSLCNKRKAFTLTPLLNGKLELRQNNVTLGTQYISSATTLEHVVLLRHADSEYLRLNASSVYTSWFVDCEYVGRTSGLRFYRNYTDANAEHKIDALVEASHLPVPPSQQNVSTAAPHNVTSPAPATTVAVLTDRDAETNEITTANASRLAYTVGEEMPNFPFICATGAVVPTDKRSSYGLFSAQIKVKAPVENVKTKGNVWLQHGDILNLQVWCNGSGPFWYCVKFLNGVHNATGNEVCNNPWVMPQCSFTVSHYFSDASDYTVLILIKNDINKVVTTIGINVYNVQKRAELSVIIVPVSAGIVAVILIVFGIAYYIQNRNRYIIEVADFDFSHASDMEYKTFRERLSEAVHNAFYKSPDDYASDQESQNGPGAGRKYGSMQ